MSFETLIEVPTHAQGDKLVLLRDNIFVMILHQNWVEMVNQT